MSKRQIMHTPHSFIKNSGTHRPRHWSLRKITCCALVLSWTSWSRAQDPAAAEARFREARALLQENRVSEACAKFAESNRLDPSSGTLLNLANCHKTEGKLATAWA